jgi:pentatricopeptide repeat protein
MGYALKGQGWEALSCFREMQMEGLAPDEVSFLCVLTACSHGGLLDEAETLFADMTREYGISPTVEHLTCMVLVFGSRGFFDKAVNVMMMVLRMTMEAITIPSADDEAVLWIALLGACRKWGNVELGKLAFELAVQLDKSCAGAYVLMASLFADAGLRHDADSVDSMRLKYASPPHARCHGNLVPKTKLERDRSASILSAFQPP